MDLYSPTQKQLDKALEMAKEGLYDSVVCLGKWNGYAVFKPIRNEPVYTGFPQFILNRYWTWRWTKDWEESMKIMDAMNTK